MDLTKDEIEYILRKIKEDFTLWDIEIEECTEFPLGLESASTRIAVCESAKETLSRLQRKFEAVLAVREDN